MNMDKSGMVWFLLLLIILVWFFITDRISSMIQVLSGEKTMSTTLAPVDNRLHRDPNEKGDFPLHA